MPSREPCLRIVEQPQDKFRFRYRTELDNPHGCLLARSSTRKSKIYPMVELVNYDKRAVIRCRLFQHQNSDEHPHALQKDAKEVTKEVPDRDSYRVSFGDMIIVNELNNVITTFLCEKFKRENPDRHIDNKQLWNDCSKKVKKLNLNIVRLRFSAHDIETDQEICYPVFSEPIRNAKAVPTNALKICRMSKLGGRPEGDEEVLMFVEKVSSKNIEVLFVERNEAGNEVWCEKAEFSKHDVHHQYAIACRTPPYRYQQIISDVKVSVMLYRRIDSDESYSEPEDFTYYAVPFAEQAKRKTPNSPCETSINTYHLPSGSTGGYSSSAMDAGVICESLNTQIDGQGETVPEPQQSQSSYTDLDSIVLDNPLNTEFADLDLYGIHKFLNDPLEADSGRGKVDAPAPPAPRDPLVKSEPEDEDQSAHKKVDAPAPRDLLVNSEPEDEDQSADKKEHTRQGDLLLASDSSGELVEVPETAFSTVTMFKYLDIFLILFFVCCGIVVAKYVY